MNATALTADLLPPADLPHARQLRDDLRRLLSAERVAAADFLLALADFDRRRGWEPLGHAGLFAFLTRELGLSNSAAWYRQSAARLLPRHPAAESALRSGRLCLSVVGELSRVLTPENEAEVLPRFLGISSREAKEVAAAILPCPNPPRRDAVTVVRTPASARATTEACLSGQSGQVAATSGPVAATSGPFAAAVTAEVRVPPAAGTVAEALPAEQGSGPAAAVPAVLHLDAAPPERSPAAPLLAPEVAQTHPARDSRDGVGRDEVRPLTAELRRLSVTVSDRFLRKMAAARDGLLHSTARATTEQVLEAALDLLLEKQARRRALVKRPRATVAVGAVASSETSPESGSEPEPEPESKSPQLPTLFADPPPPRRAGPREHIPAAVRRAVWARDGGRCQWPLDSGGCCGSTHRLELDHLVAWARGGSPTVDGVRLLCRVHNLLAARTAFGERCMARYADHASR